MEIILIIVVVIIIINAILVYIWMRCKRSPIGNDQESHNTLRTPLLDDIGECDVSVIYKDEIGANCKGANSSVYKAEIGGKTFAVKKIQIGGLIYL